MVEKTGFHRHSGSMSRFAAQREEAPSFMNRSSLSPLDFAQLARSLALGYVGTGTGTSLVYAACLLHQLSPEKHPTLIKIGALSGAILAVYSNFRFSRSHLNTVAALGGVVLAGIPATGFIEDLDSIFRQEILRHPQKVPNHLRADSAAGG